jgi:hypothetical protein
VAYLSAEVHVDEYDMIEHLEDNGYVVIKEEDYLDRDAFTDFVWMFNRGDLESAFIELQRILPNLRV